MRKVAIFAAAMAVALLPALVLGQPVDPAVVVVDPAAVVDTTPGWLDTIISAVYAVLLGLVSTAAGYVVIVLRKFAKGVGINITDLQAEKFQGQVERAIKWAADYLKIKLTGKLTEGQKDQIVTLAATKYIPENSRETVKALGGDVDNAASMKQVVSARGADTLNTPAPGVIETAKVDATLVAAGQPVAPAAPPAHVPLGSLGR